MAKRVGTYRADAELIDAANAQAARRGEKITDVIVRALREYVGGTWSPPPPVTHSGEGTGGNDGDCTHPKARRQKGLCMACGKHIT